MALSSLAPSSLTGRALGVCAGIGAAAFLGYCIYFDHSRRYGIEIVLPVAVKLGQRKTHKDP